MLNNSQNTCITFYFIRLNFLTVSKMASSNRETELCSECNSNAKWYCINEKANFCDEHTNVAHTLKSQKSHQVVPIGEKTTKQNNCENDYIPVSLFCLTCKV